MKQLNIVYILATEMAVDDFTKSLPISGFLKFCQRIDIDKGL